MTPEEQKQHMLRVIGGWNGKSGKECNVANRNKHHVNNRWMGYVSSAPCWDWSSFDYELMKEEVEKPTAEWLAKNIHKTVYSIYSIHTYVIIGIYQDKIALATTVPTYLSLALPKELYWDPAKTAPVFQKRFILPQ